MDNLIEEALQIALNAHKGQVDKAGRPYILHPLRVMAKMDTPEETAVALLHDVLEDSDESLHDMPDDVVTAVVILTKPENLSYKSYIKGVAKNKLATKVKVADLEDNMDLSRLDTITDADRNRVLERYIPAYQYLKMEMCNESI